MKRQHWTPEDRIDGRTLDEHLLLLVAKLGLSREQRVLLAGELRAALGGALTPDGLVMVNESAIGIERILALADALECAHRVTAHLGMPTRTNALRLVLREQGDEWALFDAIAQRAIPYCTPGTSRRDLNGSFRSMVQAGEVEHDGSPQGSRRYRLACRT